LTQRLFFIYNLVLQLVPLVGAAVLLGPLGSAHERVRAAPGESSLGSLLGARPFVAGALAIALLNCAMYAVLFEVPLLLAEAHDAPAAIVGRVLLAMTLAMVAGSWTGGPLSHRVGARWVVVLAGAIATAGVLLLRDATAIASPIGAVPGLVLVGLGVGLANGPAQASAMSAAPPRAAGLTAGLLSSMRYLGGAVGMLALLPLRDAHGPAFLAAHARSLTGLAVAALAASLAGAFLADTRSGRVSVGPGSGT
jgi:predicted MFS family arabinose efflux permease